MMQTKFLAWTCNKCAEENLVRDSVVEGSKFNKYRCIGCDNQVSMRQVNRYYVQRNSCPSCKSLSVRFRWLSPEFIDEFQAGLCLKCGMEWNECARDESDIKTCLNVFGNN